MPTTALEGQLCRGQTVIVAGGGNSAGQSAMFLAEGAAKVLLVISRRRRFKKHVELSLAARAGAPKHRAPAPHRDFEE